MWGELHEKKDIEIILLETIAAGKANRLLRELGATLHYDVYSFEADDFEIWQSSSLLCLSLRMNGKEVDAQSDFNEISISYLLASRPSSDQSVAIGLVDKVIDVFNAKATYQGQPFSKETVQSDWDLCNDFLLKEWGEEPGSESLRRMIEENYT